MKPERILLLLMLAILLMHGCIQNNTVPDYEKPFPEKPLPEKPPENNVSPPTPPEPEPLVCGTCEYEAEGNCKPADCCSNTDCSETNPEAYTCKNPGTIDAECQLTGYRLDDHCKEVLPGRNEQNSNKINVVFAFAGSNGNELEPGYSFEQLFRDYVFGTSENGYEFNAQLYQMYKIQGLEGIEPFKSNTDKFNYWYIDVPLYTEESELPETNGQTAMSVFQTDTAFQSHCQMPNRFVHIIGLSRNRVGNENLGSVRGNLSQQTLGARNSGAGKLGFSTFIHEFAGHTFAGVYDEKGSGNATPSEYELIVPNCFATGEPLTAEQCQANPELPWRDLIGNGCGEDGVVDCSITHYYTNALGRAVATPLDEWVYEVRAGCAEGCAYQQAHIYRPNMACNVMSTCDITLGETFEGTFNQLGVINEREACKRIEEITGQNSGTYCATLCLEGCSANERCIHGVCTTNTQIQ